MISFSIDGTSYQAEDGMTWAEWVNSTYNTSGWNIVSECWVTNLSQSVESGECIANVEIIANESYRAVDE